MRQNGQHAFQPEAIFRAFQRIRAGVYIGAVRDQHLRRFRMILVDGPHQRGFAVRFALCVDVRAMFDEQTHDVRHYRCVPRS